MSAACIVCLGDLGEGGAQETHGPPSAKSPANADPDRVDLEQQNQHSTTSAENDNENAANDKDNKAGELIAHLQPCGHNLHNECLKPWVERANSCPICRAKFTMVDLVDKIDGKYPHTSTTIANNTGDVISSYAVQDRDQVAEFDPTIFLEPAETEEEEGCDICHEDEQEDLLMICDHCSKFYHTYCVGIEQVPISHWYCDTCLVERDVDAHGDPCPPSRRRSQASSGRTLGQRRRFRNRQDPDSGWQEVWSGVFNRISLDLDFPSDDEVTARAMRHHRQRTGANQREYDAWQHRRRVASLQGGHQSRFDETAATLLPPHILSRPVRSSRVRHRPKTPESDPEENADQWLLRDQGLQEPEPAQIAAPNDQKRKRSDASTDEPSSKKVKVESPAKPEHIRPSRTYQPIPRRLSTAPLVLQNVSNEPSFLQSLLEEVGDSPVPGGSRSGHFRQPNNPSSPGSDRHSPRSGSPAISPSPSNHSSPRALSTTPPPYRNRPSSPPGLSSSIQPDFSNSDSITYTFPRPDAAQRHRAPADADRSKRPILGPQSRSNDASPSRSHLSWDDKNHVQKMVASALRPYYRPEAATAERFSITTEQFTSINRDISRSLYERIDNFEALGVEGRAKWEKVAAQEVEQAIKSLQKVKPATPVMTNGTTDGTNGTNEVNGANGASGLTTKVA